MFRALLLALDDTPGATAARDLAFALARASGARVTGLSVLDRPGTSGAYEAVPLGGGAFAERRNRARAAAVAEEAARVLEAARAAAGDLAFATIASEDAPELALLAAGAGHDLLLLGRDSTLGAEACEDGLSPTVEALLQRGARPLLVVPPGKLPDREAPVLLCTDGSLPAQRTEQLFALSGLAGGRVVKVLGFGAAGAGEVSRVVPYLALHGCQAEGFAVEGDLEAIALAEARALPASLLVLAAEGGGGLARLFFGSPTARLLRAAPCPVFLHG